MKNEINGFTFYRSYYESLKNLKEKDKKDIQNAIFEYVFEDKLPNFKGVKNTIWLLIQPNLNTSKRRSNPNSGAPEGNTNASKIKQSKNNQITTNDLIDKDKDKEKDIESENNIMLTPTLDSIISFGNSLGIDEKYCKKFFNNYESKGWKIGKNKIKNWKAKFEQWIDEDNIGKKNEENLIDEAGFVHKNGRRVI